MSRDNLERLLRQLNTLEPTVRQLLSLHRQTPILEKKLTQVEGYVMDIADEYNELALEWRQKLATWWRLYAESDSAETAEKKVAAGLEPLLSLAGSSTTTSSGIFDSLRELWNEASSAQTASQDNGDEQPDLIDLQMSKKTEPVPTINWWGAVGTPVPARTQATQSAENIWSAGPSTMTMVPIRRQSDGDDREDSPVVLLRKNHIRTELATEFSLLSKVDRIGDDIDAFRAILAAIAKADRLVLPYRTDHRLQSDVLSLIFGLLPSSSLQAFLNYHKVGSPKTVRDLKHFLSGELTRYLRSNPTAVVGENRALDLFSGLGARFSDLVSVGPLLPRNDDLSSASDSSSSSSSEAAESLPESFYNCFQWNGHQATNSNTNEPMKMRELNEPKKAPAPAHA